MPPNGRTAIVKMVVETVAVLGDAGGPTLGGDGVTAHGINLGQECDAKIGMRFGDGDGGPEPSAAGADDDNICRDQVHHRRSATTFWKRPPK
jgi:hypothetical protein